MRIYKRNQINRMAAEMLCKDLFENEGYTFTNTSYGGSGEVLGTIAMENNYDKTEGTIQYRLVTNWHTEEVKLVRHAEKIYRKTATREYKKDSQQDVVLTLYRISRYDGVYTDDKSYSDEAHDKWQKRYHHYGEAKKDGISGSHLVKFGSALYEKLFNEISRVKPVKYGSDISLDVYKYNTEKYTWEQDGTTSRTPVTEVTVSIGYVYRGRHYVISRPKFSYERKNSLHND